MLETIGFLTGIHLTILTLSAFYRLIDLWYVISEHIGKIAFNIGLILLTTWVIYAFGNQAFVNGLIYGQLFMLVGHGGFFLITRVGYWWARLRYR